MALLAKSGRDAPTVDRHNRDVRDAANLVWECVNRDLASALKLDAESLSAELLPLLRAAGLLHDLGKINSAFQEMLLSKPGQAPRQPVRHEVVSTWLLTAPNLFGKWFMGLRPEHDLWPIVWAIAGHHLKMGDPARGVKLFNLTGTNFLTLPLSDPQVGAVLRAAATDLGHPTDPPTFGDSRFDPSDDEDEGLEAQITDFAERSCRMWQRLRKNEGVVRLVALLKALLMASDASASALTADGTSPPAWIPPALGKRIDPADLDAVIAEGLEGKTAREFQTKVGASASAATVVIAGCGNGKTTAAYMWAKRHAADRKLFFTYPTTGTASAGFEDYLFDQKKLASDLIHGRAGVDLQAMRGTSERESDDEIRIDSLRAWDRQAIVCTVDTVLGLLQNQRRPLYSFPAIISGAFVFDEIHSYDARLFGGLLRFLKTFPGLPVLLMSASIPPVRLEALKAALGDRMGEVIRGDPTIEGYQRYELHRRDSADACRKDVTEALRANKKVLWVCNTVSDAIKLARDAREWAGVEPLIYHSRFRYCDRAGDKHRKGRQREVFEEFEYHKDGPLKGQRVKPSGSLVITTQVCEMSLDISADLMVTAECPLTSLVQRLGRLNRYATTDDPWPCLVYPFKGMPYNEEPTSIQTRGDCIASMRACRAVVAKFNGKPCCQRDLADRLDKMEDAERFEEYSAWLDDGWVTEPAQVRDGDASITLIREEDLDEIEREVGPRKQWTHGKLVPWTIPMLYRKEFTFTVREGGYPVAPAGAVSYCEKEGATWARSE